MRLSITSVHNPRVKHVVKLRDRRHRRREGLMLVEGYDELRLALESGVRPQSLFFCPQLIDTAELDVLLQRAEAAGAELIEVTQPVFEKMAYRENPDGWLGIAPAVDRRLAGLLPSAAPLFIVAEAVEKPGNLGAILRSADAAGVDGLIVCDPTTDISNPNVVRSSKGTVFSVPVAVATTDETLFWLHQQHIAIVATTPQADMLYTEADLRGPVAIAVGTEKHGLSSSWLAQADVRVRIPMRGRVNSLNVSTAATLVLYEVLRQRM